jgi:hypothetical protein
MSRRLCFALLALVCGVSHADPSAARADSLYARLGGADKVSIFVREAVDHADFSAADATLASERWIARICALGGGGCRGADGAWRTASVDMIEALRRAMRAQDVPLAARNELLDLLAAASGMSALVR